MEVKQKKVKVGDINSFVGKNNFTVSDLISVLNKLNKDALVNFGVIENNLNTSISFYQHENIVFKCRQNENSLEDYDTLDILTYAYEREQ